MKTSGPLVSHNITILILIFYKMLPVGTKPVKLELSLEHDASLMEGLWTGWAG